MKTLILLFVGLGPTACVASASAELSSVPFVIGKQQFKTGDGIAIDQVLAASPNFAVGDTVVVRGHYELASTGKASLGLFVTHSSPSAHDQRDSIAPSQLAPVERATGSFELSCEITYAGAVHVSFYPLPSGEALGGVYFQPR